MGCSFGTMLNSDNVFEGSSAHISYSGLLRRNSKSKPYSFNLVKDLRVLPYPYVGSGHLRYSRVLRYNVRELIRVSVRTGS